MKHKKSKKLWIIPVVILVMIGAVSSVFIFSETAQDKVKDLIGISDYGISIDSMYDADGNLIDEGTSQSTVQGISGVKYVKLKVTATNKDTVPLSLSISDSTPQAFTTALISSNSITTEPEESAEWVSGLIDITIYEGTSQKFTATIKAESSARKTTYKSYETSIAVSSDPESNFEVVITSTSESDNTNIGCSSNSDCESGETCESNQCVTSPVSCIYTYSDWGSCVSNLQTRTVTSKTPSGCVESPAPVLSQSCSVVVQCSYTYSEWSDCVSSLQSRTLLTKTPTNCLESPAPVLSQSCVVATKTYAIFRTSDINYDSNTRIAFDSTPSTCSAETTLVEYKYSGYGSSTACQGTGMDYQVGVATGGYPLVKRVGYDLSARVYIYKGGNCYFFVPTTASGSVSLSKESVNPDMEITCVA